MNKAVTIILSAIIVVMGAIIFAGVHYLYADIDEGQASAVVRALPDTPAEADTLDTSKDSSSLKDKSPAPVKTPAPATGLSEASKLNVKVKNCATGKLNTLHQGADGKLSLTDEKGKLLWKKELSSAVKGGVLEVDYFHNGKIQFMFAEGKTLHLLDRLGREVETFPRSLPAVAQSGPSLITASGKKYYKIHTEAGPLFFTLEKPAFLTKMP